MLPPQAGEHVKEPRLRIRYKNKHAPYNAGEERTVAASVARRLCILEMADPAPRRGQDDHLGGWSLSGEEARKSAELARAKKEAAGDFVKAVEADERARKEEEARVEAEAAAVNEPAKESKGPKRFLRGKKE